MFVLDRPKIILFLLGLMVFLGWQIPHPEGLTPQAWHCLIIFIVTILGIITNPFPISVMGLLGAMTMELSGTLPLEHILNSFGSKIVWIVVFAFFIAKAFFKTGLGQRIAYIFIAKIGHSVIGLSYGLIFTECILSPLIPSIAARSGGIIYPLAQSIITAYGNNADATEDNIRTTGAFIINICQHASVICSAMFLTAMAANPLIAELARSMGIHISWTTWALGACVPGLACLLILPWLVACICPPGIRYSTHGPQLAHNELDKMGAMQKNERIMLGVFLLLIIGWTTESLTGIDPTTVTIVGVLLLILTGVLSWDDAISEKSAWDTMVWFALLLSLSKQLETLGVMQYLATSYSGVIDPHLPMLWIGFILCASYFYVHYFFASLTAHVTVFYALFLKLMLLASLPPMASALILGYLSNLFGGLTHYGSSASPIFFGSGYQNIQQWWLVGIIVSTFNFILWLSLSLLWLPYIQLI